MWGVGEVGSTKVPQSLENLRSRKRQNKTGLELLVITAPKCMMYSQGSTFCLMFSHLELTLGSCSPSVNVKKISTVTKNVVKFGVLSHLIHKYSVFSHKDTVLSHLSVLGHLVDIFHLFMFFMLSMFSQRTPCSPIRDGRMKQLEES